ncbi:hypothetical protein BST10_17200 [Mycolicibacter algericus DSM 45454]|uniref:Transposase n=1 Tax=Mycolicibacter algericus DSM 45454 TaxID=723879 RepID=A0ABX3RN30_MYCAL|nr:hypothetical protein BST10_17200 [Mycolicibacter algericus DSM 45454]
MVIGDFKHDHNHRHRHSTLGYPTPVEYTSAAAIASPCRGVQQGHAARGGPQRRGRTGPRIAHRSLVGRGRRPRNRPRRQVERAAPMTRSSSCTVGRTRWPPFERRFATATPRGSPSISSTRCCRPRTGFLCSRSGHCCHGRRLLASRW